MGHFMGDAEGYRPDEDKAAAEQRDSIERLASELWAHDVSDETIDDLRSSASAPRRRSSGEKFSPTGADGLRDAVRTRCQGD